MTTVVSVGDPTAVSDDVKRSLAASGIAVSRLEGVARAETALAVARVVDSRTVLLADGSGPAAVGLGPIAYRQGWPYRSTEGLSRDSLELIDQDHLRVLVVGEGEHLPLVESQLRVTDAEVELVGQERELAEALALYSVDVLRWSGARLTLVADSYADALSAAQVAATRQAPLVVTGSPGRLSRSAERVLDEWSTRVEDVIVVGGETTVTPAAVRSVTEALPR